jgi:mitogen-activated protein kinase kinase
MASTTSTPGDEFDSDSPFGSPSPSSPTPSSPTPSDPPRPSLSPASAIDPQRPSVRSISTSGATTNMTPSSTPLGNINAARNPRPPNAPTISSRGGGLNLSSDILARMEAVRLGRQGAPPAGVPGRSNVMTPGGGGGGPAPSSPGGAMMGNPGGVPANFRPMARPNMTNLQFLAVRRHRRCPLLKSVG